MHHGAMNLEDAQRRQRRANHLFYVTTPTLLVAVPILAVGVLATLLGLLLPPFLLVGIAALAVGAGILWWGRPRR